MKNYMTMYDNESWTVGSENYNTQRAKMIAQLNSVDPVNIQFNDYFGIAEQDILPDGTDPLTSSGSKITQEEFIHVLLRALQSWGSTMAMRAISAKATATPSRTATARTLPPLRVPFRSSCPSTIT